MLCREHGRSFQEMREQAQQHAVENIIPRMRDHAGPQTFSKMCERAEQRAEYADGYHLLRALIQMAHRETQRGKHNAECCIASERGKLPLQVTAKDKFFAEARGHGHNDPKYDLPWSMRDEAF